MATVLTVLFALAMGAMVVGAILVVVGIRRAPKGVETPQGLEIVPEPHVASPKSKAEIEDAAKLHGSDPQYS